MADSIADKGRETQLRNIEAKTGKSLAELRAMIVSSGLRKHGEIRDMLKEALGLGHGDANSLTHFALASDGESAARASGATAADVLAEIYSGPKAALRPIHDRFVAAIRGFGPYETAPKKGYVSLRRRKQFAMIGPASKGQVELGLNMKGVPGTDRLVAQPPGGMCQYKVRLSAPDDVDAEILAWTRRAFDAAG
ncbi:MAG: DUF5655 domain-containing protein [Parvibaculaceae bacterium]